MKLSTEVALDLAGRFYDAALDGGAWEPAIARLRSAFGGSAAAFVQGTRQQPPVILRDVYVGLEATPEQMQRHHALLGEDPRVDWAFRNFGRAGASNLEIDPAVMRASPMYTQLLAEVDIEYTLMLPEVVDARTVMSLSVARGKQDAPFDRDDVHAMQTLRPHLLRALKTQGRLGDCEALARDLREALHRLPVGVVLLDETGRVQFVSRAAETILDRRDGLQLAAGQLDVDHLTAGRRLRGLVDEALAAAQDAHLPEDDTVTIPRTSGHAAYEVLVAPLRADRLGVWPQRPSAMLIVHDPAADPELPAPLLQRLYNLSPAEARLSSALAAGWALKDYANRVQVSVETARSQLKSAMAKTGTHRQAELIRMILRGPAAYALLPAAPEPVVEPVEAPEEESEASPRRATRGLELGSSATA